jgi:hypothetical protein
MVTPNGRKKYSSIIRLYNNVPDFELNNLINPFGNNLSFDVTLSGTSLVTTELIDISGKTLLSVKQLLYTGTNSINLGNVQTLPSGIYTLRVINKDKFITRRVVKKY